MQPPGACATFKSCRAAFECGRYGEKVFFFLTIKIYTYIFNLINCFKLNKLIFSICSTFLGKKVCVESHVNKLGRFVSRKY